MVLTFSQTSSSFLIYIFICVVETLDESFANLRRVRIAEDSQSESRPVANPCVGVSREFQESRDRLGIVRKTTQRESHREVDILIGVILKTEEQRNGFF